MSRSLSSDDSKRTRVGVEEVLLVVRPGADHRLGQGVRRPAPAPGRRPAAGWAGGLSIALMLSRLDSSTAKNSTYRLRNAGSIADRPRPPCSGSSRSRAALADPHRRPVKIRGSILVRAFLALGSRKISAAGAVLLGGRRAWRPRALGLGLRGVVVGLALGGVGLGSRRAPGAAGRPGPPGRSPRSPARPTRTPAASSGRTLGSCSRTFGLVPDAGRRGWGRPRWSDGIHEPGRAIAQGVTDRESRQASVQVNPPIRACRSLRGRRPELLISPILTLAGAELETTSRAASPPDWTMPSPPVPEPSRFARLGRIPVSLGCGKLWPATTSMSPGIPTPPQTLAEIPQGNRAQPARPDTMYSGRLLAPRRTRSRDREAGPDGRPSGSAARKVRSAPPTQDGCGGPSPERKGAPRQQLISLYRST